ncbi:MAG: hypothetical protein B5M54_03645 [Candidatus Aminicenantes bacterium 4484_214]|nr:MAG: hypothetical protein B5M54_03645 [Candidatus Aminicenantes bacterium 4484_214]RLE08295.1 MAG: hypothetical protein DRJ06_04750 [Candidatus Aminicenantes bacterium]
MKSKVYFIRADHKEPASELARKTLRVINPFWESLNLNSSSIVGLKIHFGERDNYGFINPAWLTSLIEKILNQTRRVFWTDSNTLYTGPRSNAPEHLLLAAQHGFSLDKTKLPVIIADGLVGRDKFEVTLNLPFIKKAKIASLFATIDYLFCLSHFTGHILTGFGGAIKNLGMGCASRVGKLEQHSNVHPWIKAKACRFCLLCMDFCPASAIVPEENKVRIIDEKCIGCGECLAVCPVGAIRLRWSESSELLQKKMAEYAFAIQNGLHLQAFYLNFLVKITKDCDCMSQEKKFIIDDIGLLSSQDPVAIDQASVDLVNHQAGADIIGKLTNINWRHQLEHGEQIGLGVRQYELVEVDDNF